MKIKISKKTWDELVENNFKSCKEILDKMVNDLIIREDGKIPVYAEDLKKNFRRSLPDDKKLREMISKTLSKQYDIK